MELKEFVENTITQITDGVSSAKNKAEGKLEIANAWKDITFDLLIQEEDIIHKGTDKTKEGSVKVLKVVNVGLDSTEQEESSNKNIVSNRVRFSIPAAYR